MKPIEFFCYNEINEKHFNGAVKSVQYALLRNLQQLGYEVETVDKCLNIFAFLKRTLCLKNGQDIVFTYEHIPLFSFTSYLINMIGKVGYFLLGIMKKIKGIKVTVHILDIPLKQIEELNIEKLLFGNKMISKKFLKKYEKSFLEKADVIVTYSENFTNEVRKIVPKANIVEIPILPNADIGCDEEIKEDVKEFMKNHDVNIFYSGELSREYEKNKIKEMAEVMKQSDKAGIIICGNGGEWIKGENVLYLGQLNLDIHNKIAKACDFGIIIYPNEGYYKITPTTKLSNYIINNLPILSVYSETISKNIQEFGIGESFPEKDFYIEINKWISEKSFEQYRQNVISLKEKLIGAYFEKIWINS